MVPRRDQVRRGIVREEIGDEGDARAGSGRMSENLDARVKIGDCLGEGAMMMLVPAATRRRG